MAIDTMNRFLVGLQGNRLHILNRPALAAGLTGEDAIQLAAWLVTMAPVVLPPGDDARQLFDDTYQRLRTEGG
jgi:hypothetical protein